MSFGEKIAPDLQQMIDNISTKNMYSGNKIPDSIMNQFFLEVRDSGAGVLVPFWLSVLQDGRGPRRATKSSGLVKKIFNWMNKRGMFKSSTRRGKLAEAKAMTWYINKYGNQQFRNKVFVDIYKTERAKTIAIIDNKVGFAINEITMEVI